MGFKKSEIGAGVFAVANTWPLTPLSDARWHSYPGNLNATSSAV